MLTVGTIAVSNPRPQLITDAMHFAWIGLLKCMLLKVPVIASQNTNITK